jgi:hypothetical protein
MSTLSPYDELMSAVARVHLHLNADARTIQLLREENEKLRRENEIIHREIMHPTHPVDIPWSARSEAIRKQPGEMDEQYVLRLKAKLKDDAGPKPDQKGTSGEPRE